MEPMEKVDKNIHKKTQNFTYLLVSVTYGILALHNNAHLFIGVDQVKIHKLVFEFRNDRKFHLF
jgi:hypothetical protein